MKTLSLKSYAAASHPLLTLSLLVLSILLAASASIAQAAEFQPAAYSRTRPNGQTVTLTFDSKGKFVLTDKDGKTLVEGSYKLIKDQIEFTDEKGPVASKEAKPGKYRWKLDGKKLNFTRVED